MSLNMSVMALMIAALAMSCTSMYTASACKGKPAAEIAGVVSGDYHIAMEEKTTAGKAPKSFTVERVKAGQWLFWEKSKDKGSAAKLQACTIDKNTYVEFTDNKGKMGFVLLKYLGKAANETHRLGIMGFDKKLLDELKIPYKETNNKKWKSLTVDNAKVTPELMVKAMKSGSVFTAIPIKTLREKMKKMKKTVKNPAGKSSLKTQPDKGVKKKDALKK